MKFSITKEGNLLFKTDIGVLNYTQRNNKYVYIHPKTEINMTNALTMCNVTSYCEAGEINKFRFPKGRFEQPEDNLGEFIMTNENVLAYYKKVMPAMYAEFERGDKGSYCPNEIHAVLAYGFNKWMGCSDEKPIATFRDNCPINEIIAEIIDNDSAVVMSGTFPYKYANGNMGTIGHINVLVGVQFSKDQLEKQKINIQNYNSIASNIKKIMPDTFIFDDPYGSMYDNFKTGTGNDVMVKSKDFITYYKPLNDMTVKYAHIFRKSAAVI